MRILLVSVLAFAVPESVHCQEEDDTKLDEEMMDEGQLRSLHGLIDAHTDGKVSLPEILTFARTVARQKAWQDASTIMEKIDTSKDGKVSFEEHISDIKVHFDGADEAMSDATFKFQVADSNKDQLLDLEELTSLIHPEKHDAVFKLTVQETMRHRDKNGDFKLTPEEFWEEKRNVGKLTPEGWWTFNKLDTNGDGALELSEIRQYESGAYHTEYAMTKLFKTADKDSDMHVTVDELAGAHNYVSRNDAHSYLREWIDHHEL